MATEEYQVAALREDAEQDGATFLDREAVRAEVNSPTYLAGVWDKGGTALVQPGPAGLGPGRRLRAARRPHPGTHAGYRPGC